MPLKEEALHEARRSEGELLNDVADVRCSVRSGPRAGDRGVDDVFEILFQTRLVHEARG